MKLDRRTVLSGTAALVAAPLVAASPAHADAKRKAEAMGQEEMQKLTAGLPIPPGMKLPF